MRLALILFRPTKYLALHWRDGILRMLSASGRAADGQTDRLHDPPTTHFMRRIHTGTICAAPG
jgi:hypothetical protein